MIILLKNPKGWVPVPPPVNVRGFPALFQKKVGKFLVDVLPPLSEKLVRPRRQLHHSAILKIAEGANKRWNFFPSRCAVFFCWSVFHIFSLNLSNLTEDLSKLASVSVAFGSSCWRRNNDLVSVLLYLDGRVCRWNSLVFPRILRAKLFETSLRLVTLFIGSLRLLIDSHHLPSLALTVSK